MMTNFNWTPFIVLGLGLLQALLLYSLRSFISNALLQLELKLGEKYATKDDLKKLESDIDLAKRVDTGFADVTSMLRRGTGAGGGR